MTDTVISSATREVVIGFDRPFVIIGERINPTGRKILAAEMAAGDFSRVEADARAQVEAGAHMLDVNAGIPLADEPAILARASASTRLKSPAAISAARILRPVGLMRSPMMTNGRLKPMTTSLVAELITVSVMRLSCENIGGRRAAGTRESDLEERRIYRRFRPPTLPGDRP